MFRRVLIAVLILVGACSALASQGTAPEVWIGHLGQQELGDAGAKWDFVKGNLDCMQTPINAFAFIYPADKVRALAAVLRENHIKIAIECGYFDWQSVSDDFSAPNPKGITDTIRGTICGGIGERTARTEIAKIANLTDAGALPDYLNLDGPIRRLMLPGMDVSRTDTKGIGSIDRAVDEMISYMRVWRAKFPKLQFFYLTNFPNCGWKGESSYWDSGMFFGDDYVALGRIIAKTRKAGIPILGVTADYPYGYFTGKQAHKGWAKLPNEPKPTRGPSDPSKIDWSKRLLDLDRYVESEGLEFNLIVNSEIGGGTSDEAYHKDTLDYIRDYHKAGGSAKRYLVETWYAHPTKVEPEDEPYTMTNLVKAAIKAIKLTSTTSP